MSSSMTFATLIRAASVLVLVQQVSGACYRPDGVDRNSRPGVKPNDYQPCNKDGGHSMCCSTVFSDTCRANGLCYNEGAKLLWRESCTDPTWKDPACIKLCAGADQLSEKGVPMSTIDSVITICGDNSLCCGSGDFAQRCCDAKKGYKILPNGQVVEAHPEPKTTTTPTPAAPKVTTTQKNDPPPAASPTQQPANPSPNTGSGGGGGGNTSDGGSNGGGGGGNTGDGNGGSNSGSGGSSSGGSGGNGGSSSGSGDGASPDMSDIPGSTTDPTGDDEGGTGSSGDGKSSSTPKESQKDGDSDNQSSSDGSSGGTGNGNKDSKDSSSSADGNGNDSSSGTSSGGTNKNGVGNTDGSNNNGNSGTEPTGGNGNNGALIGGVVGGVLGGLVLFALAAWYVVRQRRAISALRLASASELPGTDGRTFYEVPGDSKQQVVEQVVYTQGKATESSTYYEMAARSPVLAAPTRYS